MTESELLEFLKANDYTKLRRLPTGELAGLTHFAFTTAIVVGIDEHGYRIRYCYPNSSDAAAAFESYTGESHPSGMWVKAKGRGIDLLNPDWVKSP